MTWTVALDPPAVISGRTELSLNGGGITVDQKGIDWGDAQIEAFKATQKWGENTVAYRVPNRTVTIPLFLGGSALALGVEEEVRGKLRQKVGLLQREGGVLLRQRLGGSPLYADVMSASLVLPDVWGETGEVEPGVVLVLECLPDFYGEEIALDAVEGTGQIVSVLKQAGVQAVIGGDYPARARIVLTEKSKHDQLGLLWGLRSRHYDSAGTAALYQKPWELTAINGAERSFPTYVAIGKPEVGVWHPFLTTDSFEGAKPLTHVGSYRVWARVSSPAETQLRFVWSLDDAITPTTNAAVTIPGDSNDYLVDLGDVNISQPPVGEHWWRGILQVKATVSDPFYVFGLWFQPVDDGAGQLRATGESTSTLLGPSETPTTAENAGAGPEWTNPSGALKTGEEAKATFAKANEETRVLKLTKLGFKLPVGVSVKGIEVKWPSSTPGDLLGVQLYKAGVLAGSKKTLIAGHEFGSSSDLWGTTWTLAQIEEAGFGVGITAKQMGVGGPLWCDVTGPVVVRVYYSYSSSAITGDAVLYSERVSEIRTEGGFREDTTTGAYVGVSELQGDLPRLPPSGLEGRAVELLIKNSRGDLTSAKVDAGVDAIQAQVKYRPCYLGRI